MTDPIALTNQAALQNDRWLFIAALVALGLVAIAVARYFVGARVVEARDHKELVAEYRQAQAGYQQTLTDLVEKGNKTHQELAVCLDRNTRAFEEVSAAVRFCRERK